MLRVYEQSATQIHSSMLAARLSSGICGDYRIPHAIHAQGPLRPAFLFWGAVKAVTSNPGAVCEVCVPEHPWNSRYHSCYAWVLGGAKRAGVLNENPPATAIDLGVDGIESLLREASDDGCPSWCSGQGVMCGEPSSFSTLDAIVCPFIHREAKTCLPLIVSSSSLLTWKKGQTRAG